MRLKTFGGLAVLNDDGMADDVRIQRRQLAVLVVLAAEASSSVSRERLVGLLWADTEEGKARHALDQVLYAVRRALGAEVVISGATSLQLDVTVLPSDVAEFEAALARGDLAAAVAVYSGPFLDAVSLSDTPAFAHWIDGRRARYANLFVQALMRLATSARDAHDHARSVGYLRRAAASDPLSDHVTRELMLALAYSGDTSAALAAGRVHCALIREQLEAEPDGSIVSLMEEVRTGTLQVPKAPPPVIEVAAPITDAVGTQHTPSVGLTVSGTVRALRRADALALGLTAIALLGARFVRDHAAEAGPVILRGRSQITTSGKIRQPAVSADGRYIAYVAADCRTGGCTQAIELQEVGGSVTRRILEGATALDYLAWSPDGRNLLVAGTLPGKNRAFQKLYLLSALGGEPLPLCQCGGGFFAGGDSLLLAPSVPGGSRWLLVAGLDGIARDSIPVAGAEGEINYALSVPDSPWIVVDLQKPWASELLVIDRTGRVKDRASVPWIDNYQVSADAVWLSLSQRTHYSIVRVPFDPVAGRLSAARDTVYTGAFTAFDVTADGRHLILDEGTDDYELWALDFHEALRGEFPPARRLAHSSSQFAISISPDGRRVLIARESGFAKGFDFKLATMAFAGGVETAIPTRGEPRAWTWADSRTIAVDEFETGRAHLSLVDVQSGAQRSEFTPADTALACCPTPLPRGGWAWSPPSGQVIKVQRPGEVTARLYPKPEWFGGIYSFNLSPDGHHLLYAGSNATADTMRVSVMSLVDGSTVQWWSASGVQGIDPYWLSDGSVLLAVHTAPEVLTFYQLRSPGHGDSLGTIPRPVHAAEVAPDLKHAVVSTREHHGDAWMYQVERR